MLKKLLIPALLMLAVGTVSAGNMTLIEEAAEFETLNVRVSSKGKGNFRLLQCEDARCSGAFRWYAACTPDRHGPRPMGPELRRVP